MLLFYLLCSLRSVNGLRKAKSGNELPNAKSVSMALFASDSSTARRLSLMVMHFGQFLDHDITLTAGTEGKYRLLC